MKINLLFITDNKEKVLLSNDYWSDIKLILTVIREKDKDDLDTLMNKFTIKNNKVIISSPFQSDFN